nr:probable G-protein coupled receptor 83 [Dermatophagoides farinae]
MLTNDTYRNERIFYGIAYLCIIILSFFGNLLVCKICWQKLTKTNTLIISMAISDLLMTIFNIPFNFFRIVNFSWPFGQIVCFVVNFVQHCAVYISTYTMAIIALQRYYSVYRFRSALQLSIDQQQEQNHIYRCRNPINNDIENFIQQTFHIKADLFKTIIVFITQYFIPLSTICYLYIEIGKIIHQQGKLCNVKGNAKTRIRQRKKNRRLLMLILMVMVFAICWLPLHLFHILIDIGLIDYNYRIFMMVHWLAMSSVSYNPFIYCWLNKNFRHTTISIFFTCFSMFIYRQLSGH